MTKSRGIGHGGARKGSGRPRKGDEIRGATLSGVSIEPSKLETYRQAAVRAGLSLTDWVESRLDSAVSDEQKKST